MIDLNRDEQEVDPFLERDQEDFGVTVQAIPDTAMSLEASTLSLLGGQGDAKAIEDYTQTMSISRDEQPVYMQTKRDQLRQQFNQAYGAALFPVLSDPTIPIGTKQAAIDSQRKGDTSPVDPANMLMNETLASESRGESLSAEQVRLKISDNLLAVQKSVADSQVVVNAAIGAKKGSIQRLGEVFEAFIPGSDAVFTGMIGYKREGGVVGTAAAILPGTAKKNLSDSVRKMGPEERVAFAKEIASVVKESSGIFTDVNQLQAESFLNEVVRGQYSDSDKYVDNLFNILDLVGIGGTLKNMGRVGKGLKSSFSAAKASAMESDMASNLSRVDPAMSTPVREAGPIAGVTGDAKITQVPQTTKTASKIEALEAEYAANLEQTSGKLESREVVELRAAKEQLQVALRESLPTADLKKPGMATAMVERKVDIKSQISAIDSRLENNAIANKAEQRLVEIEKEKDVLSRNMESTPAPLDPLAAAIQRAYNQSTFVTHHPRSPGSILYLTNPAKAKSLHAQVYLDETGAVAQATHGVAREEALLKGVSPQVTDKTGRVKKAPDDIENTLRTVLASELGMSVKNSFGGFAFSEKEIASARAAKVSDYSGVSGINLNSAMSSFEFDGAKAKINAVYTNGQGGWLQAEEAVSQAKFSLQKQGIKDQDVEVLRLDGGEYVPVKLEEVRGVEGDYVVRISREDQLSDMDVTDWDNLTVKRNLFDRFQTSGNNSQGSWNRFFVDPASTLDKRITGSMSVADDKAAKLTAELLQVFETKFTTPFMSLKKDRKELLEGYIKEANVKEYKFDPVALSNKFNKKELDILRGWRDAWDIAWTFENLDLVRTLRKDGFQYFDTPNLTAVVKQRPKRFENRRVYDSASDSNRVLTDAEINDIYAKGGFIGEFRRPLDLHGESMEYLIVRNTPNEYARKLNDSDKMLEYRDGYYQVSYKNPKFIDETVTDSRGKVTTRTLAVTSSIAEADQIVKKLSAQNPGNQYKYRGDDRKVSRNSDMYWDMNHVGGRIAQRHRGQLLENGVGLKQMGSIDFIESPADSAMKASLSIGGRMAMRQTLEVSKERFINQYSHLLIKEDGFARFPSSRDQIVMKGEASTKELADARTTWEYINYMENGYLNVMDDKLKAALNIFADFAGLRGLDTVENLARAGSDANITGTVKGGVFASMIASNPLRQYIVQMNQGLRMLAYNPKAFLSGNIQKYSTAYFFKDTKMKFSADTKEFLDFFHDTGMSQAITRGNLIRGTLLEASGRYSTADKLSKATVGKLREVGYDKAENGNLVIHAAAVYDKYKRAGANIKDAAIREQMHQETRALTGNMNFAGDMPYNQNWMALMFTYMQVPHKFMLQSLNRQLTVAERTRLVSADMTFWGLPTGMVAYFVGQDLLPEDEDIRHIVTDGLESWVINRSLSSLTGERQNIDFSSLAPYDMDGWGKIMNSFFFDGGIKGIIDNSPTARVFGLSVDSRTGLALKTSRDYFMSFTDMADSYTNPEFVDVMDNWGKMSTGWTNYQKARSMWHFGVSRDKQGRLTDDDTTRVEAIAQLFGFGPKDTASYYKVMMDSTVKNAKDAAKADVKQLKTMINSYTNGDTTGAKATKMFTQQMADMASKPSTQYHAEYMAGVMSEMQAPAWQKEMEKLTQIVGFPSLDITRDPFYLSSMDEEKKKRMVDVHTRSVENWIKLEKQAEELKE